MSAIRKSARDKPCLVRLPGCNGDPATTVHAHYRLAGYSGVGMKPRDSMGARACSYCHDAIDQRIKTDHDRQALRLAHAEGCLRTIAALADEGLISVVT